jgi:RNA polymerase sigma-70 factor (ECF subfamily)
VVVIRAALDLRRSAKPDAACEEETLADVAAPGDDVELSLIKAHYRKEFKEAFAVALETLSSRERSVLRLHLLDGLNIEQIGALYKAHRATVARWIAGSRKKLDSATREALAVKLKLGEQELASLVGLVQSQLEVSLSRLLATRER